MHEGFQSAVGDTYDVACGSSGERIASPSCATYVTGRINEYATEQMTRKDNAIANAMYTANRVFDADKNSSYAMIRSNDVLRARDIVTNVASGDLRKTTLDNDVTRRQFEINEYHYHNKLDTLFFLQVFFIAVLVMAILFYFNRRGFLTTKMTGFLIALLAIVVLIIAISRYFYTIRTRDRRLWHRRYFQTEKEPSPDLITTCPGPSTGTTINLNALFDTDQVQCAIDTNARYNTWRETVDAEIASQTKGTNASGYFTSSSPTPASCKRR